MKNAGKLFLSQQAYNSEFLYTFAEITYNTKIL